MSKLNDTNVIRTQTRHAIRVRVWECVYLSHTSDSYNKVKSNKNKLFTQERVREERTTTHNNTQLSAQQSSEVEVKSE